MDNEKLLKERNEKLARFAGFWQICESQWRDGSNYAFETNTIYKNGRKLMPDFEKVDNCIKWLIPNIENLNNIMFFPSTLGVKWILNIRGYLKTHNLEGSTLAEAIEKYVDWESERE